MPQRNGRVVNWKTRVGEWCGTINDDDLNHKTKIKMLALVLDKYHVFGEDDFAERLRDAATIEDLHEQEVMADEIIAEVYDFADQNLIWMGV